MGAVTAWLPLPASLDGSLASYCFYLCRRSALRVYRTNNITENKGHDNVSDNAYFFLPTDLN